MTIRYVGPAGDFQERQALSQANSRSLDQVKSELKGLIVENFAIEDITPEKITDDRDLFGANGIGLDSLDGVELVVVLHRQYGLNAKQIQKNREVFQSINTLSAYVHANATK